MTALLILTLACAARHPAPIGLTADAGLGVYANDDHLTIVSPWASAGKELGDTFDVDFAWKADVISAATVDIVSSATTPFEETRHEGSVTVGADLRETRFSTSAIVSAESDTFATTVTGAAERDLLGRTLTLSLAYGGTFLAVGTVSEARERWGDRQVHQLQATATRVLTKQAVLTGSYTVQLHEGALANPYLKVPTFPSDESQWDRAHASWVPERLPDLRVRSSFDLKGRYALSGHVFAWAGWRGYLDTWAMRGHTGEVGLAVDLARGVILELSDRVHWQSSVSFYRDVYTVNREYLTADRRLGELFTEDAGLAFRLVRRPVEVLVSGHGEWTRYAEARALLNDELAPYPDTLAIIGQAAVSAEF